MNGTYRGLGEQMISDTLFDAIEDLKHYTEDPFWRSVYGEATISETEDLMLRMDALREKLDTPEEPALRAAWKACCMVDPKELP